MQGLQINFFTQQDCRHGHTPMAEWLLLEARKLGLNGGTLMGTGEVFAHDSKLHSAHFFVGRLFERLRDEKVDVFYVKPPIEFGMTSET